MPRSLQPSALCRQPSPLDYARSDPESVEGSVFRTPSAIGHLAGSRGAANVITLDHVKRLVLSTVVIAMMSLTAVGSVRPQGPVGTDPDALAIQEFNDAIARYLELRGRLGNELPKMAVGSSTEINSASNALAAAIQRSRPRLPAGSFFTPAAAAVLKRRVLGAVKAANLSAALAGIDDDGPVPRNPAVYMRFPVDSMMATMPPSLLAALPQLPKELRYRIMGAALVLRDVDAALILDYIPSAVPRQ